MQIEILQENLVTALNQLQRIIPSKPQLPILSSILFTAEQNKISLAATDLYVGMHTLVAGKVTTEGKVAIPGKIFHDSIASLDPGKLSLKLEENTLTITANNNITTIQCLPPDEFPDFPEIEGEQHSLDAASVQQIESDVNFSASIDPTRPVLTALLFSFSSDNLLVVGTDGFRLATLKLKSEKTEESHQFLIPAKAMSEVARINSQLEQETVQFTISEELKQTLFTLGDTQLFVRMIEGEYPPFQKIIPEEFETEVVIDGEMFVNQLKRAQVFARESSNIVKLFVEDKELRVVASSPTYGSQEGTLPVEVVSGGGKEIAFNTRYLLDFMAALKPEKVVFQMNESLTPAKLQPAEANEFAYIVMPFRVNE